MTLQPLRDETDENLVKNSGNWHKVFEYCEAKEFREAIIENGEEYFLIIQMDTDIFGGDNLAEKYQVATKDENNQYLATEIIVENTVQKLVELIGEHFYIKHQNQIIFAISVQSIECWLLPIYYNDNKKSKAINCLNTLNQALKKQEDFIIIEKQPLYYRAIAEKYRKSKILKKGYENQTSFAIFIQDLTKRNLTFEEDDW